MLAVAGLVLSVASGVLGEPAKVTGAETSTANVKENIGPAFENKKVKSVLRGNNPPTLRNFTRGIMCYLA